MTRTVNKKNIFNTIKQAPQNVIGYISGGVARIFAPRDDNYPETGVQPFDGERPKKKHY